MSNSDKAIAILRATNDGNDLTPSDLRLLEGAVNNHLTEVGLAAFDKLHADVIAGTYVKPWFHGIEGLTKDHQGYVHWRGQRVEHYSYGDYDREHEAALALTESCRSLEARDLPVSWGTVGTLTPFADAPKGTPWVEAMRNAYTVFCMDGKPVWLVFHLHRDGIHAVAVSMVQGTPVLRYAAGDVSNYGAYYLFHQLQGEGLKSDGEALRTYASFVATMDAVGVTPDIVRRVLATDLPRVAA